MSNELQSLAQIFQNKLFRIPDYQRGYAWQNSQLRDFWEDLVNLRPDRYHYTGLLSMRKLNQEERKLLPNEDQWLLRSGYSAYHIVDGQQRLTTFVILLNEILTLVCNLPENKGKDNRLIYLDCDSIYSIRENYICRKRPPDGLIVTYKFGYENDNPSSEYLKYKVFEQPFGGTIQETYYTKNLKYAKAFFQKELTAFYGAHGINGIIELYHKLTLQMMFNTHEIEDDYDVFVAFETMNNRGKHLTNLELLKNRLIYLTTLFDKTILDEDGEKALRDLINNAWKEVYYQLGRNDEGLLSDDEFLRAHWIMYFYYSRKKGDDYINFLLTKFSHKSILGTILSSVPDSNEDAGVSDSEDDEEDTAPSIDDSVSINFVNSKYIQDYVNSLKETAEYWYYSFYPDKCPTLSEEEQVWIVKLNRIGIGYFRPLITVSLMPRLGITKQQRLSFFQAVERFIFIIFRMAMYQSSYKSSDYSRKIHEVYNGTTSLDNITDDLNQTVNDNAADAIRMFISKMNHRFIAADGFYSWRDLKYFLYEYEYSLSLKYKIEKLSWALLTTVVKDKITVEHILPQTPTKYYWRNTFRQFSDDEIRQLSSSLGNMLPLSQSINSGLQNDSFDKKKQRGYANGSHCEVEISKKDEWNAEEIYNRGIALLRFMEDRWDFRFDNQKQMDELLHISFVNDGRDIPAELTDDNMNEDDLQTATEIRHEARLKYWTYALPIIQNKFGGKGHPFGGITPSGDLQKQGFFGIKGIHLYISVNMKKECTAGLWIDTGEKQTAKILFDTLYAHKNEIEAHMSLPITWNRKDDRRYSTIDITLEDADFTDPAQWNKISQFHADRAKELADNIFYPYEDELRSLYFM